MTGSTLNISYLTSKHYISMLYTNEDMRKMEILSINFVKPAKCIITSVEEKQAFNEIQMSCLIRDPNKTRTNGMLFKYHKKYLIKLNCKYQFQRDTSIIKLKQ